MPDIKLLSPSLQNQIAAGEVVERPASIVKELVENAIDAGGKNIVLEIEQGGIKKIRVIDDGKGMSEQDAKMSIQRYATSKISTVDDLFSLSSFGFRGEALASIASVSSFTLRTKQKNRVTGIEIKNNDEPKKCAATIGTEILVENLFWNVPARRKFLKSEISETKEIVKVFERFALSHPQISFKMIKDGKDLLSFPSSGTKENSRAKRVEQILGPDFSHALLPILFDGENIKISGFISHPHITRSNRDRQYFFVNSRMVINDKLIAYAAKNAYHTLIEKGKNPAFVVYLDINPEEVDVNVHPRKTEVKFIEPQKISQVLKGSFLSALTRKQTALSRPSAQNTSFSPNNITHTVGNNVSYGRGTDNLEGSFASLPSSIERNFISQPPKTHAVPFFEDNEVVPEKPKIIGQIRNSFILIEEKDGIKVVDQHAAHERVRLEMLKKQREEGSIVSQPLLVPAIFTVSAREKIMIEEEAEDIEKIGFRLSQVSDDQIAVTAVPAGTEKVDISQLFRDLLDDLDQFDPEFGQTIQKISDKALSYAACRGAIKFGDKLSMIEMEKLITDWKNCKTPQGCAHGRPVYTDISFKNLENECSRY